MAPRSALLNVRRARAPRELLNDLKFAAQREGVGSSEFVRRALRDPVRAVDGTGVAG